VKFLGILPLYKQLIDVGNFSEVPCGTIPNASHILISFARLIYFDAGHLRAVNCILEY